MKKSQRILFNNKDAKRGHFHCLPQMRGTSVAAVRAWNDLPASIKESESLEIFKSTLKHLLSDCFPSYLHQKNLQCSVVEAHEKQPTTSSNL